MEYSNDWLVALPLAQVTSVGQILAVCGGVAIGESSEVDVRHRLFSDESGQGLAG